MEKTKWVTIEHEIKVNITKEDINIIFSGPGDDSLKCWLMQMNDIAIFLKGTPTSMLCKLSKEQKSVISNALIEIAERLIKETA